MLQLHRDLYKFSSAKGGNYKNTDNVIEEILPNGTKYIRFKPVDSKLGYFTKNEIRTICPDVGEATINRVFEKLRV